MPLLIFGATGQVATELRARCPQARVLSRSEADLADPEACAARIADLAPEAVINAAGIDFAFPTQTLYLAGDSNRKLDISSRILCFSSRVNTSKLVNA